MDCQSFRQLLKSGAEDWNISGARLQFQRILPFLWVFVRARSEVFLSVGRDFVVEIMLESAIWAAGIPLIEDSLDLIWNALLSFEMLVEFSRRLSHLRGLMPLLGCHIELLNWLCCDWARPCGMLNKPPGCCCCWLL